MLTEKRYEIILDLLDENEVIKSSTIAGATNSSESTIRRDLINLEKKGLLKRVHGGAKSLSNKINTLLKDDNTRVFENRVIGEVCANLIKENELVFLDGSDIAQHIAKNLNIKNVKIFTNSLNTALLLSKTSSNIYFLGGKLNKDLNSTTGIGFMNELHKLFFDKAFLSADGVDYVKGFTVDCIDTGKVNEIINKNSKITYIVANNSKINKKANFKFLNIDSGILITNNSENLKDFEDINIIKV
ncbi:DeoR/GlpR family DNA-binding transcription regulator [uncultured Clostridium sp.]|uniref:DeoR/GlpR family DNA-binding transcription regulator n=1 Tax=uncultured Clostridium sp. TaxID=59620 RepID=UPI00262AF586|nr:DeoR/GlpR family DNA-binding transcription regulator [uncultured Clostridium sp.]